MDQSTGLQNTIKGSAFLTLTCLHLASRSATEGINTGLGRTSALPLGVIALPQFEIWKVSSCFLVDGLKLCSRESFGHALRLGRELCLDVKKVFFKEFSFGDSG